MRNKLINKKGFTLAELLIVVAIIAVLVAVSIPIFTSQLEKARESTDVANFRAAKAEVIAKYLSEDGQLAPDGYYNANKGVFVTEFSEVGDGYGKGTEIEGSTSAADDYGYIDGFYNIGVDYTGGVISYVYDKDNDKLFLGWVVPGDSVAGSVGQFNVGRQFEVELNKN